jgi:hypothetical protein
VVLLRHLAPVVLAILIAFTFEEMLTHPSTKICDSMFHKSKMWNQMYKATSSSTYWISSLKGQG